jgi:hypothetical protein
MIIDYIDNKWTFNAEEFGVLIPKFASTVFLIWWTNFFVSKLLDSEIELYNRFCLSGVGNVTCNFRHCYIESVSSLMDSIDKVGGAIGVTALLFAASGVAALATRRISYLKEVAIAEEQRHKLEALMQRGVCQITPQKLASMTDKEVSTVLTQAVVDGIRLHDYSTTQRVGSWT